MSANRLSPSGPLPTNGSATLVAGLATVAVPVPVGSSVTLARAAADATTHVATWGALAVFVATDRLSFTIVSGLNTDVSVINYSVS